MKTHDLAKQLQSAASALMQAPNMELSGLVAPSTPRQNSARRRRDEGLAFFEQLQTILSLSKSQWKSLVEDYGLPLDIKDRDSARNILGKLIELYREHPEELVRIRNKVAHSHVEANPELTDALNVLLGRK